MRNIPVFTTEYGVASLILKEIPYRKEAYVRLQSTLEPQKLLDECVSFCRMAGAEKIYAQGHEFLDQYPLHTAVWKMTRPVDGLPETEAMTMPVTEDTLEKWREIYNNAMADVPNAAFMDLQDAKAMLTKGDGYFVHKNGTLLGIGKASGDTVEAIVSVCPGAGQDVLIALTHALFCEDITLEVASENARAVRLYDRLGFVKSAELSRWYVVGDVVCV